MKYLIVAAMLQGCPFHTVQHVVRGDFEANTIRSLEKKKDFEANTGTA